MVFVGLNLLGGILNGRCYMYRGYRIVVVVPAGRRRYLELQLVHVLRCRGFVDEYRYWLNTLVVEDIEYMESVVGLYGGFATLDRRADERMGLENICMFFRGCVDSGTIYVRLDDDVVWFEEGALERLLDFRIDNPRYFLVHGNVVNNSVCDHLHQRMGVYDLVIGHDLDCRVEYRCVGNGTNDPVLAVIKHNTFLGNVRAGGLERYKFGSWVLFYFERVSINCICWFGSEFVCFSGVVGREEEQWLSCDKPADLGRFNCVCGSALFSHFAFHTQREVVDRTNLLERYRSLAVE